MKVGLKPRPSARSPRKDWRQQRQDDPKKVEKKVYKKCWAAVQADPARNKKKKVKRAKVKSRLVQLKSQGRLAETLVRLSEEQAKFKEEKGRHGT